MVVNLLNIAVLKELMKYKGIKNMRQLSEITRIPYTTLNYMLSGHDMYVSTIVELSKYFGVPLDYLINKTYGVAMYKENEYKFIPNSNIIEVTALYMM